MPLFQPNLDCQIRRLSATNVYGEEELGQPVSARCAVIKLRRFVETSSVRADSSASRGTAREIQIEGKLLFPYDTVILENDQVEVSGMKVRVIGVFLRHDLRGNPDHQEVEVSSWAK